MRFTKLKFKNLFSYGNYYSEVQLNQDGIIFVRGVNKDDNTSNGSGKSSIIDIFIWTLFGKPMKNVPADDVKNSHSKGAGHACLEFWLGDDYYEINRYRNDKEYGNGVVVKKNSITDDSFTNGTNRDVQKRLDDLLGLDYHSMTSSIIFTSEVPFLFPKLSPEKRRAQLESMLGLQAYSDYGKLAKQRVKLFRRELEDFILEEREKKTFLESQRDDLESYTKLHKNFSTDKETAVNELKAELHKLQSELSLIDLDERNNLEIQVAKLEVRIEDVKEKINHQSKLLIDETHNIKSKEREIKDLEKSFSDGKKQVFNQHKKDVKAHQDKIDLMQSECPTCSRGWEDGEVQDNTHHHEEEITKIHNNVDVTIEKLTTEHNYNIANLQTNLSDLQNSGIQEELENLEKQLDAKVAEVSEAKTMLRDLPTHDKIKNSEDQIEALENRIEQKESETNPYKEVIDGLSIRINDYLEQLDSLEGKRESVEDKLKYASFWDESFNNDGLKLFIFESIVPVLNNRIGFYLPLLFLDKEIKVVLDKFMNMTTIKDGKSISYGGLSRGERKRVDLAIALSLLDTAQAQHGTISNCMFFDEIFDSSLDSQGVRTITEILQSMPVETIFIMSHRLEISHEFDNVLDVEKSGPFSRILT